MYSPNIDRFEEWQAKEMKKLDKPCPHDKQRCVPLYADASCRKCYEEAHGKV